MPGQANAKKYYAKPDPAALHWACGSVYAGPFHDSSVRLVDDAAPAFVWPGQPDDSTNPSAPRRADPRRPPVGAIVRSARTTWIVKEPEENRTSDSATGCALDHALARGNSSAHIETAHRSARNRERSCSAGPFQAKDAPVDGFNGAT